MGLGAAPKILKDAEHRGCRVTRAKKYYKIWCGCDDKDWMTLPLTPSNPYTFKNKHAIMAKWSCWNREVPR